MGSLHLPSKGEKVLPVIALIHVLQSHIFAHTNGNLTSRTLVLDVRVLARDGAGNPAGTRPRELNGA